MPAFLPIALALSDPKTQAKANSLLAQAEKLICKLKGSCGPKFQAVIAQVGIAGYRKGTTSQWEFYLSNGLNLTQDLTKKHNAQAWYFGSGYWEKLRNAGLDNCCLKSKWPPSEAFPLLNKPLPKAVFINLPNGDQVAVDPEVFDPSSFQIELDEYFRKTGKENNGKIVTPNEKKDVLQTPIIASTGALLPLALLFLFSGKGGS